MQVLAVSSETIFLLMHKIPKKYPNYNDMPAYLAYLAILKKKQKEYTWSDNNVISPALTKSHLAS